MQSCFIGLSVKLTDEFNDPINEENFMPSIKSGLQNAGMWRSSVALCMCSALAAV